MIIEIKETNYKGILIEKAEDKGWKCNLGGQEYLFPTFVDAQATVDEIFRDIKPIIVKNGGKKFKSSNKPKQREFTTSPEEMTNKELQSTLLEILKLGEENWPLEELDRVLDELNKRKA